ncbi:hypothetical protein [Clostridium autoethanogenum]|uniref:PD-(D/E)XK endonuclease-like domain-containing protein n=1 Tax=Clostridium autoethanogenum DSM 10061 TaxID=1341692 RepID=A0ABM5NZ11_9CLOT|nr:hypothetical protein [Clostridium autoethanogenum]AGY77744.1 hypothetical protein CAETHG_3541 [Clostridium autoethanogenum DSM 10061]ALU37879.1 hypothetical protein CLAU_3452 [Clostridium autoethanogenum DSM 10061]OVY49770.1 hypothetical protein WX72_03149 [Clostridium autoethanogenum]
MEDFLEKEIKSPFEKMGFEIVSEDGELYDIKDDFKELENEFYSGERLSYMNKIFGRNLETMKVEDFPKAEKHECEKCVYKDICLN